MMSEDDDLPRITTDFDLDRQVYCELIHRSLRKTLPCKFFDIYQKGQGDFEKLSEYFQSTLPLSTSTLCSAVPGHMTFFVLSKHRKNSFKFFSEIISRWLIPVKQINIVFSYSADFYMPDLSPDLYTLSELSIRVDSQKDWQVIQRNLPIIESEIRLGIKSSDQASRILEVKGVDADEKTVMIQENIASMVSKLPQSLSHGILNEMQQILVMSRQEFKVIRSIRHLTRMICIQSFFLQSIRQKVKDSPKKRHFKLKIFKAKLQNSEGNKTVLGVIIAVNFLLDKEIFEERHLVKAIQNYLPDVQAVKDSFFFNRRGKEPIETLYVELEKNNGEEFKREEISVLRNELPLNLEESIEHVMHPIFMPRNEEEIMRNMLILSDQLHYLRDIPQVFISFDEQTNKHLFFTVILVRFVKSETLTIEEMFRQSDTFLDYIHDRCKTIGYLRKKYRKEATVFRLKLLKEQFLRSDHSIDLYQARQVVVSEIFEVMGEVRDYNGGMIHKQNEHLVKVRELMKGEVKYHDLLLENFFYSLNPVIMRTLLEPATMKKLFLMLLEAISEGFCNDENYLMKIRAEPNSIYVIIAAADKKFQKEINRLLSQLHLPSSILATASVYVQETPYIGYVFLSGDPFKQRQFCVAIQHAVEACEQQKR